MFKHSLSNYRKLIKTAKNKYYIDQIKSAGKDTKKLFRISSTLLGKLTKRILPDNSPLTNATNFESYFYIKTSSIIDTLSLDPASHQYQAQYTHFPLFHYQPLSISIIFY